jgi:hypothetical protein
LKRRLLNLLTALSLLLCVAVVALWVRSYWVADYLCYTRLTPRETVVRAEDVAVVVSEGGVAALVTLQGYEVDSPEVPAALSVAGLSWEVSDVGLPELDRTFVGFGYDVPRRGGLPSAPHGRPAGPTIFGSGARSGSTNSVLASGSIRRCGE